VKIAMGTDSGVSPHGQNLDELHEMTEIGMSQSDVWEAATRVAAELLGVAEDRGTLEVGKRADLVRFAGTSLDVADLRPRVAAVYQDGQQVSG
jgi:imidazolonepropionase-like amidohydrolase